MGWKFNVLVLVNVTAVSDELLAALKRRASGAVSHPYWCWPPAAGAPGARRPRRGSTMRSPGWEAEGASWRSRP